MNYNMILSKIIIFLSILSINASTQSNALIEKAILKTEIRAQAILDTETYHKFNVASDKIRLVGPVILDHYAELSRSNPSKIQEYAHLAVAEIQNAIIKSAKSISNLERRSFISVIFTGLVRVSVIFGIVSFGLFVFYLRGIAHQNYCLNNPCDDDLLFEDVQNEFVE